MAAINKTLFPFASTYPQLQDKWWHRLAVVIFYAVIIGIGIYTWQSALEADISPQTFCIQTVYEVYTASPVSQDSLNQNNIGLQKCESDFPTHRIQDFFLGLTASLITFYLLQVIYYKIFLYIVFGKTSIK
jgi:hypothetical protein